MDGDFKTVDLESNVTVEIRGVDASSFISTPLSSLVGRAILGIMPAGYSEQISDPVHQSVRCFFSGGFIHFSRSERMEAYEDGTPAEQTIEVNFGHCERDDDHYNITKLRSQITFDETGKDTQAQSIGNVNKGAGLVEDEAENFNQVPQELLGFISKIDISLLTFISNTQAYRRFILIENNNDETLKFKAVRDTAALLSKIPDLILDDTEEGYAKLKSFVSTLDTALGNALSKSRFSMRTALVHYDFSAGEDEVEGKPFFDEITEGVLPQELIGKIISAWMVLREKIPA